MKHLLDRLGVSALALFLLAFAMPSSAVEATKISDVAHSVFFRGGSGTRGAAGTNGGHYTDRYFNGNFTDYTYCNGSGATELVIDVSHIVTDPEGQAYVTDVLVGHQGNAQYSLYYTNEPEPENLETYASDPRTWTPIAGADHVQEAGTKTYGVNDFATAVKYVFNTCPQWTTHLAEVEVQGYEYVPAKAVKISAVGRSVFFRGGSGTRGVAGTNGGHASDRYFNGDFTDYTYCNGSGVTELVIPTTGLDDQGNDTGVAWYVTDFKVGHQGNAQYSLYYTTEAEPANLTTYASDPRTWTLIAGADHVQEAGTKTFGVNAFATAVKYVFNTCPNWTTHLAEVEVWAMNPASITCLHPNMTDDYPAWTNCTAATCTENGFEERFCPDCGARFEREVPYSKLGHDFVATLTVPGSATAYGSGYVECSRCNEFHLVFDGDTVDLTTLGGPPIQGVVQYTELYASSLGAEDGGIKPIYMMDNIWDNGWGHAYYFAECSSNEYAQYSFGTTIDLTKIEYSVINESQTVYFSKYDPATGEETLLRTIPIKKDTSEGAPGYQRKTEMFFGEGDVEHVFVDAIRMRIGHYVDPDTGEVTNYIGYNYGAHDRHTIICEFHPWGTIEGAGMTGTPVAMIGDTSYMSLAAAIEAAEDGDTIVLQKDDDVSFSAENLELSINKALVIDGNGHVLYGVNDYAGGSGDHDIYISGTTNVTIRNITLAGFGGAVPVTGRTYPIWTGSAYAGTLTLDRVTVTNFNRTAFNLNGGTVLVKNCTIAGDMAKDFQGGVFQEGIGVYNANVTVENTTITGAGSTIEREGSQVAACIQLGNPNGPTPGTGSILVKSGTFAGEYGIIVASNATATVAVQGGSFTGALMVEDGEGGSIAVSGGTFDDVVPEAFCASGFIPRDNGNGTYGVESGWKIAFADEDATVLLETNVVAGVSPVYVGEAPTKAADAQYTYCFAGWTNLVTGAGYGPEAALPAATANATYTAFFTNVVNRYTVTFSWHGDTDATDYDYGTAAADVAVPGDPPSYVDDGTVYTFTGWSAEVPATITADVTITAQYAGAAAVAKTIDGATTNFYASLWAAIDDAPAGSTVVLVADDEISFATVAVDERVPSNGSIVIDKALTIDGDGHTVAGVSNAEILNATAADVPGYDMTADLVNGSNLLGFFVKSGDVTFKNLTLTEFGDTAYVNKFGYTPIQTASAYADDLVIENVDFDKFNRTAVCVRGGTLTMTGGTVTANAANKTDDHFQQPIEVRGGTALIDGVTVESDFAYDNGGGAIVAWSATTLTNVVVDFKGVGIWADYPVVTVVGADTSVEATDKALFVEDGGLITVAAGAFNGALAVDGIDGSAIAVSGGTFDEVVRASYCAEGYAPVAEPDAQGNYTVVRVYEVAFVLPNDSVVTNVPAGDVPVWPLESPPSKESTLEYDYFFVGWAPDEFETTPLAELPPATQATNFWALFGQSAIEYRITLNLNDGELVGIDPSDWSGNERVYTVEDSFELPMPVKTGCEFVGWVEGEVDSPVASVWISCSTGDRVFSAVWEETLPPEIDLSDPETAPTAAEIAAGAVPAGVQTDETTDEEEFVVCFHGKAGVTYQLQGSATLGLTEEQWKSPALAVGDAVRCTVDGGLVRLEFPMGGENVPDRMFFRVGASRTPAASGD